MDLFRLAERAMAMDADAWARHANPGSVYSRFAILPALALAVWSRTWLGLWCVVPVALIVLFAWLNPRLIPPARPRGWAGRGSLGERVWLRRRRMPIPPVHRRWGLALSGLAAVGLLPLGIGLARFDAALVLVGLLMSMGGKACFLGHMARLWQRTYPAHPDLVGWAATGRPPTGRDIDPGGFTDP